MIALSLKKKEDTFKNAENELLSLFYVSATGKTNEQFRFAKVDNHLDKFLPYLKDGAVKLYLYYAFVSNSKTGESWHSIETLSRKLKVTERSISNWNKQLEDVGLIYRTGTGKKSKATFVLPQTGFAVKLSIQQIQQALFELGLNDISAYTKIFGKVQSITKLYVRGDVEDTINEVVCVHLQRVVTVDSVEVNRINIFMYNTTSMTNENTVKKLWAFERERKVAIVNGDKEILIGGQKMPLNRSFFINVSTKINDNAIYSIMSQLIDDIDLSDLPQITI